MRRVISLSTVVFAVTLGIFVGNKLSSEAMAVVVGVVCGVLASIPMSVMILIVTRRLSTPARPQDNTPPQQHGVYPPVIVIQSDNQTRQARLPSPWSSPTVDEQPMRRSFTVVGEEDWEE